MGKTPFFFLSLPFPRATKYRGRHWIIPERHLKETRERESMASFTVWGGQKLVRMLTNLGHPNPR